MSFYFSLSPLGTTPERRLVATRESVGEESDANPRSRSVGQRSTPRHLGAAEGAEVDHPPRKEHTRPVVEWHTGDVTGLAK